ncbi:unnamed protein product [Pieris macdunnoughi]|uniref:DDE-1 domain-containing protein n=1 Tax=Pieris macdunnoughi TaxID=345717 RepID=A0A821XKJ6_9NEOP|nr:unnamed protein product [Pieris macdunnoughi]
MKRLAFLKEFLKSGSLISGLHCAKDTHQRKSLTLMKQQRYYLSILDAILMISEAWEKVTQTTIANCFRHAGFKDLSPSQAEDDDDIPR